MAMIREAERTTGGATTKAGLGKNDAWALLVTIVLALLLPGWVLLLVPLLIVFLLWLTLK